MSSPLVAVADIECPNRSKLALLEGQQMATIANSDVLLLTKPHFYFSIKGEESVNCGTEGDGNLTWLTSWMHREQAANKELRQ